eukprot:TRINITY_DN1787_c0_g1_i1.p1 TRINITY_DN1787_c0_g1~~TRINITY_DN1787_c0_g1_i1.p1  ORF type:complete len:140 (+),score=11.83 TRINITY_DN1787_c0_g1_i1:26-445(+)
MMQYPFHIESPLLLSRPLTNHIGIPVYLKMDSLQPTGSFKIRGLGYACWQAVKERGATSFVCASGGNAGFAVAYAGRCLGLPVTIVLPESTPVHIRHLLASHEQANVIVHGLSLIRTHLMNIIECYIYLSFEEINVEKI